MAGACLIVESKASRVTSSVQASMEQSTPEGRTPLQTTPIKVDFQLWKFGPFLLIDFYKNLKIIKSGGSHTHQVNRYVLQLQLNAASLSIHYRCNIERGAKTSHCAVPSTTIISATFHEIFKRIHHVSTNSNIQVAMRPTSTKQCQVDFPPGQCRLNDNLSQIIQMTKLTTLTWIEFQPREVKIRAACRNNLLAAGGGFMSFDFNLLNTGSHLEPMTLAAESHCWT